MKIERKDREYYLKASGKYMKPEFFPYFWIIYVNYVLYKRYKENKHLKNMKSY